MSDTTNPTDPNDPPPCDCIEFRDTYYCIAECLCGNVDDTAGAAEWCGRQNELLKQRSVPSLSELEELMRETHANVFVPRKHEDFRVLIGSEGAFLPDLPSVVAWLKEQRGQ